MSTLQDLYTKSRSLFKNFSHPALEIKLLICASASLSEEEFFSNQQKELSRSQERLFYRLVSKRLAGFPSAYLTNSQEFWSLPFKVFPGVLIPRPETESVVERVLKLSSGKEEIIVDVGTGCGNIAISLAKELSQTRIIAVDISEKALKTARLNASIHQTKTIEFINGDLLDPLKDLNLIDKCDFIVSNPPYVSKSDWEKLQMEILNHEPRRALVAGDTGLEVIRKLIREAPDYLLPGGYLVFEIGAGQRDDCVDQFENKWNQVESFDDLSGIPRVISAQKKGKA